jgi:uncharacterized protein DUF4054
VIVFTQFIQDYPEFANASQAQFLMYQNRATIHLCGNWGQPSPGTDPTQYTQYDMGMELIICHFLALAAFRAQQAANGGPALTRGAISSESAGPNSVNYDLSQVTQEDAGQWNLTPYGIDYVQMARYVGAAPTQAIPTPNQNPLNGPAWIGPWPIPGGFGGN